MNNKEFNSIVKKINNWYSKKTKVLSIRTRPYNSAAIFSNLINKVLNNNGKILYVWSTTDNNINRKLKQYFNLLVTDEQQRQSYEKNIKFITIDKVVNIHEDYDLVIFDDITVFSEVTSDRMREAIEEVYWRSRRIIVYSCEKTFPLGEKIDLVYLLSIEPMIEPRYISTRIKLEEDIPLTLYDYLKWFKENNKNALIFVPSEDKLNKVYNHYYNILKKDNIRVIKYNEGQNFSFIEENLDDSESLFIVTNNIGDYINEIPNLNIIVLFSDDIFFSYKRILYLCGSLNKEENILPEAILVSREVSENMDKAKSLTRGYNKKLWEKKLLKL